MSWQWVGRHRASNREGLTSVRTQSVGRYNQPQIRPLTDIVHSKHLFTYSFTYSFTSWCLAAERRCCLEAVAETGLSCAVRYWGAVPLSADNIYLLCIRCCIVEMSHSVVNCSIVLVFVVSCCVRCTADDGPSWAATVRRPRLCCYSCSRC